MSKIVETENSNGEKQEFIIDDDSDVYRLDRNWITRDDVTKIGEAGSFEDAIEVAKAQSGGRVTSIKDR